MKLKLSILAVLAIAAIGAAATPANASNPAYALRLSQEGYRVSAQIGRLAAAGQRSNSLPKICGYYVPQIRAKVRRLRQIVSLLYVYAPSSMRSQITSISRTVTRLRSMSNTMNTLCVVYG